MIRSLLNIFCCALLGLSQIAVASAAEFDVIIRQGKVFAGDLSEPRIADVGIRGDRIAQIGDLSPARGKLEIDATDLVVAPGFINTLSWATETLIIDGRSQSDIRQGVTLEVFGEGVSMGPLNAQQKAALKARQSDVQFDISWTTLGEYLSFLESRGVSPNVASFVGATTIRTHVIGYDNRPPTAAELEQMQALVASAMREGALGVGSSLIYAPATFASTAELKALVSTAQAHGGMYISHIRSEGDRLLEAVDELIEIARDTGARAEIYHLKVSGQANWHKLQPLLTRIEAARSAGLAIGANMYTYTAGSTGLDAAMPPWVQEGGLAAWIERLKDPEIRARVAAAMVGGKHDTKQQAAADPQAPWENLLRQATAEGTLLVGFKNPALRHYIGQTLAQVAQQREQPPHETAIDLVIADGSRVQVVYFLMSAENVAEIIAQPWVTFGSDAGSYTAAGVFLKQGTHPRAYGNFARVLGKYSRDEGRLSLNQAIHRLSYLPARRFKLSDRGALKPGYYADVAIFDPATIQDHATYARPHQYASGMHHVLVNGIPVLRDGEHTGALPGRFVRGPGWQQPASASDPNS
ncbi:MAG: D-aminoacylase [Pseudomonadales bacterium]